MYNLALSKESIETYVTGLDSSIKLIGGQLANSQNSCLALRGLIDKLVSINKELMELDKLIDQTDKEVSAE